MARVYCENWNARFSVSSWRTADPPETQICFSERAEAEDEFIRQCETNNFRWVAWYEWIDDVLKWGDPIASWPDDFDEQD